MTTVFQLTRKGVMYDISIDDCDSDLLQYKWYIHFRRDAVNGVYRNIPRRETQAQQTRLHRAIMERIEGRAIAPHEFVDHKDLNTLNNQRSNLRLATNGQNCANKGVHKNNKLGVKGVRMNNRGDGYNARIRVNKVAVNLGTFRTIEEAHQAYVDAAIKYHGEYARGE